jgi:hypothetical protein
LIIAHSILKWHVPKSSAATAPFYVSRSGVSDSLPRVISRQTTRPYLTLRATNRYDGPAALRVAVLHVACGSMHQRHHTEAQRRVNSAFVELAAALDSEGEAEFNLLRAIIRYEATLLRGGGCEPFEGDPRPRARALFHRSQAKGGLHSEVVQLHDRWKAGMSLGSPN